MDSLQKKSLEDVLETGLRNHAGWAYVEQQIRRMAQRFRVRGGNHVPTDAEIDDFLSAREQKYRQAVGDWS